MNQSVLPLNTVQAAASLPPVRCEWANSFKGTILNVIGQLEGLVLWAAIPLAVGAILLFIVSVTTQHRNTFLDVIKWMLLGLLLLAILPTVIDSLIPDTIRGSCQ